MIDSRMLSFGKYNSIFNKQNNENLNIKNALSFFDYIEAREISCTENEKFIDGYLQNFYTQIHKNSCFSSQHIFAFTNVSEKEFFSKTSFSFSQRKVKNFWEKSDNDYNRLYSMLHIKDASKEDLVSIISWLNTIFNSDSEEYKALFYFSFDYTDIIICAKNLLVADYISKVFKLNYGDETDSSGKKYSEFIKDSFSVMSFENDFLKNCFYLIEKNYGEEYEKIEEILLSSFGSNKQKIITEKLNIVFNMGVQNIGVYNEFCKDLKTFGIEPKEFCLLGRHDFTINRESTNLIWLVIILFLVFKHTKLNADEPFFNCETLISKNYDVEKIFNTNNFEKKKNSVINLKNVQDILKRKIDDLVNNEKGQEILTPAHRDTLNVLYYSFLEILKNGFADDFIVCVYEPFVSCLEYLKTKIEQDNDNLFYNVDCMFNNFLEIISSLANSVMHNDRQFVQTPSFNISFDVPPKLLAFYTVITNRVMQLYNTDAASNRYSFIFKPNYSRDISVLIYSFKEKPPADRLLAVSINEKSLYQPTKVVNIIAHEVAHYVGDAQRKRDSRSMYWIKSILFISLKLAIIDVEPCILQKENFDQELAILIKKIYEQNIQKYNFKADISDYSDNFCLVTSLVFEIFYKDVNIDFLLETFLQKLFNEKNILIIKDDIKQTIKMMSYFIPKDHAVYIQTDFDLGKQFNTNYKILLSVFCETYADIQMILTMNLSLSGYIENFLAHEGIEIEMITKEKIYYRVCSVICTLINLRIWKIEDLENEFLDEKTKKVYLDFKRTIALINNKQSKIADFKENLTKTTIEEYLIKLLCEYLKEVVCETQKSYKGNAQKDDIVTLFDTVINFEDAIDVFYAIQKTNKEYLKKITSYN